MFSDVTNGVSASKSEPSKLDEDLSRHLHDRGRNGFLLNSGAESEQLQRKSGKVSKTGNLHSKRPRITQLEDSISVAGVDGIKDMSDKLGSYLTKCNSSGNIMFFTVILNLSM